MHKLLLVEDEKNFASVLKDYLKMNGYAVTLCENGDLGLSVFKSEQFDLCIVDVMMPKKDGFTLVNEIKEINATIPVIFLTAKTLREDVIRGYKTGADDYITKPFDSEVLLYKIKAILSRHSKPVSAIEEFEIGSFLFNSKLRTLKQSDKETKLSPKEAALLKMLCEFKNDVMPREKALKEIWKDESYFTGRSMDVYIVKLRKFLASDGKIEINNLHGNGYSLQVKV
jgi:two-component system, OmpR family, response regulator